MKKIKNSVLIAQRGINSRIDELHAIYLKAQSTGEERIPLVSRLKELTENNPDFEEIAGDHLSHFMYFLYVLAVVFICGVDFFLLVNGIAIVCDQFNLPHLIKWLAPPILIVVEVAVSYMCVVKERNGEMKSWFSKMLQYFVILLLTGFTAMTCIFSAGGYNAEFDTVSFSKYFGGIVFYQAIFLLASILSHIWLILNSENIVMAFAYFRYKSERNRLARAIDAIDRNARNKSKPKFKKKATELTKEKDAYCTKNPEYPVDFGKAMPNDLILAINSVMGRIVFTPHTDANYGSNLIR